MCGPAINSSRVSPTAYMWGKFESSAMFGLMFTRALRCRHPVTAG